MLLTPAGKSKRILFALDLPRRAVSTRWSPAPLSTQDSFHMNNELFAHRIPGLKNVLVDGFRHKLDGVEHPLYFLTHWHSDHYCGLTSTWKAGRIICTTVTANLFTLLNGSTKSAGKSLRAIAEEKPRPCVSL